uniref:Uncharacterized protein n=1 Tax=Anguilla anguilla TaxID=7936 RepID=A0A0E9QFN1_ANGAN
MWCWVRVQSQCRPPKWYQRRVRGGMLNDSFYTTVPSVVFQISSATYAPPH